MKVLRPGAVVVPKLVESPAPRSELILPSLPPAVRGSPKTAVVSGLGPNGALAVLRLLASGFRVTGVEHRAAYVRQIHLGLRRSYLADLAALDPVLHERVMRIATPVREEQRIDLVSGRVSRLIRPVLDTAPPVRGRDIRGRLANPRVVHARIDHLEQLYFARLREIAAEDPARLQLLANKQVNVQLDPHGEHHSVAISDSPKTPGAGDGLTLITTPDLIVLAEGGKSRNARFLDNLRLSRPKLYMSGHVRAPLGPISRRVETVAGALGFQGGPGIPVSLWATGHGRDEIGTWVVLEVPGTMAVHSSRAALDYFLRGTKLLFGLDGLEERDILLAAQASGPGDDLGRESTFGGMFSFQQQFLDHPAAGLNVVSLGDGSGMSHHDEGGGLELGISDLEPLGDLADTIVRGGNRRAGVERYAAEVRRARVALLSVGMHEYYPEVDFDSSPLIELAAAAENPTESFEQLLRQRGAQPVGDVWRPSQAP